MALDPVNPDDRCVGPDATLARRATHSTSGRFRIPPAGIGATGHRGDGHSAAKTEWIPVA
jgi:hypothetical protein